MSRAVNRARVERSRDQAPTRRTSAIVEAMVRVLHWNGRDIPEELRELPPGDYVVQPVGAVAPLLTEEAEEGIRTALASRDAGRVVGQDEVRLSVDARLKR